MKAGFVYGVNDEIGYHALEDRMKLSQNSENLQKSGATQQNGGQQKLSWRQKSELTRDR